MDTFDLVVVGAGACYTPLEGNMANKNRLEWPGRYQNLPGGESLQQSDSLRNRIVSWRRMGQTPTIQRPQVQQHAGHVRV